jgi:amino acid adenylation domain-containing protein
MIPSVIVVLSSFPLNSNGKVDRKLFPATDELFAFQTDSSKNAENLPPSDDIEAKVLSCMSQTLQNEFSCMNSDFFRSGGHSLSATKLSILLEKEFNIKFPVADVFRNPSARSLSTQIKTRLQMHVKSSNPLATPICLNHKVGPASFAQIGVIVHQSIQSQPEYCYRIPLCFKIDGNIEKICFQQTLLKLHHRHPVLRSTLHMTESGVEQRVHSAADLPLHIHIQTHPRSDARGTDAIINEFIESSTRLDFDLSSEPMWKVRILQLSDQLTIVVLCFHHAAFDGASCGIIVKELQQLLQEPKRTLPDLQLQYLDYCAWEQSQVEQLRASPSACEWSLSLSFWDELLRGAGENRGRFATDRPHPLVRSGVGGCVRVEVSDSVLRGMHACIQRTQCTFFSLMLAVTGVVLQSACGSGDICVGSVASLRSSHPELDSLVGFFVNTVVYRLQMDADTTFESLLSSSRRQVVDVMQHCQVPWEMVLDHVCRGDRANSLFDVMMSLDVVPDEAPSFEIPSSSSSARVRVLESELISAIFDLDVNVKLSESRNRMLIDFNYATDVFDRRTIEGISARFQIIFDALFVQSSDNVQLRNFDLRSPEESKWIAELNSSASLPENHSIICACHNIGDFLCISFKQFADREALAYMDQSTTFSELLSASEHIAHHLYQVRKLEPGSVVGVCIDRSIEMVVAMLGVMLGGFVYLPIHPSVPTYRARNLLKMSGAVEVLCHLPTVKYCLEIFDGYVSISTFSANQSIVDFQILADDIKRLEWIPELFSAVSNEHSEKNDYFNTHSQSKFTKDKFSSHSSPLYIVPTSGSTGEPKLVAVTHGNMINYIDGWANNFIQPSDHQPSILQLCKTSFDAHIEETLVALCCGMRVVLIRSDGLLDFEYLVETIESQSVTHLDPVPSLMSAIVEYVQCGESSGCRWDRLQSVRCVMLGGESPSPSLVRDLLRGLHTDARVFNTYGPAECSIVSTLWRCERPAVDGLDFGFGEGVLPIGRPLRNYACAVLDSWLRPVSVGSVGELYIGGAGVFAGYWGRDDLTAGALVDLKHVHAGMGRSYRTGDLVRVLEGGWLVFVGRSDSQVKIRGQRLELGEIESIILSCSEISQCAVVCRVDEKTNIKYLAAFVRPSSRLGLTLSSTSILFYSF